MAKLKKEYNPNRPDKRLRRPIIYIICEGKETETLYFRNFRARNCLVDIVPMRTKHTAAEHLVKHAKALLSQAEAMMVSHTPEDELSDFFAGFIQPTPTLALDDIPTGESASPPLYPTGHIDSMGLW